MQARIQVQPRVAESQDSIYQDIRFLMLGCGTLAPHISVSASLPLVCADWKLCTDCLSLAYFNWGFQPVPFPVPVSCSEGLCTRSWSSCWVRIPEDLHKTVPLCLPLTSLVNSAASCWMPKLKNLVSCQRSNPKVIVNVYWIFCLFLLSHNCTFMMRTYPECYLQTIED